MLILRCVRHASAPLPAPRSLYRSRVRVVIHEPERDVPSAQLPGGWVDRLVAGPPAAGRVPAPVPGGHSPAAARSPDAPAAAGSESSAKREKRGGQTMNVVYEQHACTDEMRHGMDNTQNLHSGMEVLARCGKFVTINQIDYWSYPICPECASS